MECSYSNQLIKKLSELANTNSVALDFVAIRKAISFIKEYHDGQYRKSGEPFYTHPIQVAYLISDYLLKTDVIVASILHDVVEDTEATIKMVHNEFGGRIAEMVDMLTRYRPDGTKLTVEQILENAYKTNDKEVLLIKLIDRLHNLQTLNCMPQNKKINTSFETLNYFIAITMHLENYDLERKFIKICYKYIHNTGVIDDINIIKDDSSVHDFLNRVLQNNSETYHQV